MNKKYFTQIYGCQMNYSDAERISAIMEDLDFVKTRKREDADVVFFITCSVRQTAEDRVFGSRQVYEKLKKDNPNLRIILTGCMAKRNYRTEDDKQKAERRKQVYRKDLEAKLPWVDHIIEIDEITSLYDLFGEEKNNIEHYLSVPPRYNTEHIAHVPISTGCNNFCSYCIVPFTRGPEKSRPFKEVVHEVAGLIHNGYKEINLLGQNVNSYGNDLGEKNLFPRLLQEIDKIKGDYWIRFVSCHPKDVSEKLMDVVAKSKHIVPQVHFALQSGDNELLKKMNRPYTKEQYLEIVDKFKKKIPDIALTTDVIVGFPGETEEQLKETANVMKEVGFTMVYINKYSPRKGTKSAELEDNISWEEKGRRKNILNGILTKTSAEYNERFLNKKIKVLVTNIKKEELYGHNAQGIDVKVNYLPELNSPSAKGKCLEETEEIYSSSHQHENLMGQFVTVKITETGSWGMKGCLITDK